MEIEKFDCHKFVAKNFVKLIFYLNTLLQIDLTGNFCMEVNFSFFHTVLLCDFVTAVTALKEIAIFDSTRAYEFPIQVY